MIKVSNRKVINNLAMKSFKANKTRNIIAVAAIALTTILFTALFTICLGLVETIQNETMRQAGGSAHATLKYLNKQQFEDMKKHPLVKEVGTCIFLSFGENEEFIKRHTEIFYADEIESKMGFSMPTTGRLPIEENEISADTVTLDLLGVPHEIGRRVTLEYSIKDKKIKHDFVLSGFFEGDPAHSIGMITVSQKFIDKELAGITSNYWKDNDVTGTYRADIMFSDSLNIEENIEKVITESGYEIFQEGNNGIAYGVNWSYMSTNINTDPATIIQIIIVALLIILTGYLIIYNIFQISVIKDIRFYGLLKTIGTTPKQIKRIIITQALVLSAIGIPCGLMAGYFIGVELLPLIVNISNFTGRTSVSASPTIFIGAVLFSLATVFLSCSKPGRIASRVSPVEAVRYSGAASGIKRSVKRSYDGAKIYKMALSNLGRNKKRTAIVVLSMSLSIILLNSVFTISTGFDMDKFLSRFVTSDYLIGHANYFNTLNSFRAKEDELSQSFIDAVNAQAGIEDAGRIYFDIGYSSAQKNGWDVQLYGLEDFPLSQLEIVDGKLDIEKFKSGEYIIEGLGDDDNGNIYWQTSYGKVGEKVALKTQSGVHEYTIMAKCRKTSSNDVRYTFKDGYYFYLSDNEYKNIVAEPVVMSYQFNVDDEHIQAIEQFVKDYTTTAEPNMNYESKLMFVSQFKKLQNTLISVGGVLSLVIGIIGILNFVNSMLTSIITRRQEFAMMQSIGMTDKQLHKLLVFEGLFFALGTIALSLVLGTAISLFVIKAAIGNLWLFSYKFVILPMLISYPFLILLSVAIPYVAYYGARRQSIVERIRDVE